MLWAKKTSPLDKRAGLSSDYWQFFNVVPSLFYGAQFRLEYRLNAYFLQTFGEWMSQTIQIIRRLRHWIPLTPISKRMRMIKGFSLNKLSAYRWPVKDLSTRVFFVQQNFFINYFSAQLCLTNFSPAVLRLLTVLSSVWNAFLYPSSCFVVLSQLKTQLNYLSHHTFRVLLWQERIFKYWNFWNRKPRLGFLYFLRYLKRQLLLFLPSKYFWLKNHLYVNLCYLVVQVKQKNLVFWQVVPQTVKQNLFETQLLAQLNWHWWQAIYHEILGGILRAPCRILPTFWNMTPKYSQQLSAEDNREHTSFFQRFYFQFKNFYAFVSANQAMYQWRYLRFLLAFLVFYSVFLKTFRYLIRYIRYFIEEYPKQFYTIECVTYMLESFYQYTSALAGFRVHYAGSIGGRYRRKWGSTLTVQKGSLGLASFNTTLAYDQVECITRYGCVSIRLWFKYVPAFSTHFERIAPKKVSKRFNWYKRWQREKGLTL